MFCENCGSRIDDGVLFCTNCGTRVVKAAAPILPESAPAVSEAPADSAVYSAPVQAAAPAAPAAPVQAAAPAAPAPVQAAAPFAPAAPVVAAAPAQEAPSAPQAPNIPAPSSVPAPSGGAKFGSVLLVMLGGLFLFIFVTLLVPRWVISKSSVKSIILDSEVLEYLEDASYDFRRLDIADALEEDDDLLDFSCGLISHALKVILTGEGEIIDIDKAMDYFEDHVDDLEDTFDKKISDDDLDELRDELKHEFRDVEEDISDDIEAISVIHTIFSTKLLILALAVVLLLFGLVFIIFGKRLDKSLIYSGVSTIVHSVLIIAFGVFLLLITIVENDFEGVIIVKNWAWKQAVAGCVVLVLGIVSVILGKVYRKKKGITA